MAPTRRANEIEGRSYKEYVYSPAPASSSSAACDSTTLGEDHPEEKQSIPVDEECRPPPFPSASKCFCQTEKKMTENGSTFLQYVAAAIGNLCVVATGAMLGWTSPILPKLKKVDPDNPLLEPIADEEASWIGSLVAIGAMVGSFVAGYFAERWGRKRSLMFSVVPFLIGWILIGTATHVAQLYVARLILGLALAFAFTIIPMYVGEIAETSVRGALGSFLQLFITIGLLYSYAIGPSVSYTNFCIACASLPIVFVVCFAFMPESPHYLLANGRKDEAISALARLRSKTPAGVQKEVDEMQVAIEEASRVQTTVADLFKVKANRKALAYTCALAGFQQLTGINVVLFYMDDIFEAAENPLPAPTVIVGVVQMLASTVTPLVVDRLGRRLLLVISGVGEIASLGVLGLYFYLKERSVLSPSELSDISWIPVTSLVIFISFYCIGWGPLPWAVMGEMFASDVKPQASGITVSVCWLLAFVMTKFTTNINAFGMYTTFWGFTVFCVISVLFAVFILPETKGKSLREIQDELNGVKSASSDMESSGSGMKKM